MATPFSIENIGGSIGLGTTDARATAINILNWVLGILVLACLVYFLFGFALNWTASGDSEVVRERARRVMTSSLIGMVVVLLAWAIVTFVAGTTRNVTV